MVSDQKVSTDYVIQGGDLLSHTVHRHEPGVAVHSDKSPFVSIVSETSDVLVVDKPGTLPIHPCGGYHVQSLMNILEPQFGKLYTIHRLDRLTSGIVILGKTTSVAQRLAKCVMDRHCKKLYLARVVGKFPLKAQTNLALTEVPVNGEWSQSLDETEVGGPKDQDPVELARRKNACGYWMTDPLGNVQTGVTLQNVFDARRNEEDWLQCLSDGEASSDDMYWFHLACPTRIAQPKDGICLAGTFNDLDSETYLKTVKPAQTSFAVLRYDPETDSTILLCHPVTGRTHQIRLHLQYLGHPIANDPNYGGDMWYGNPSGLEMCRKAQAKLNEINASNKEEIDRLNQGKSELAVSTSSARIDLPATEEEIQTGVLQASRNEAETIDDFVKRTCVWCARSRTGGTDRGTLEFLIRSPGIWLHALQYSFEGLDGGTATFRTPLPSWSQ